MAEMPESLAEVIRSVHGEAGERWLEGFKRLVEVCEQRWACQVQEPYSLSYNYVAPVRFKDGGEAVLKLCVPGPEYRAEREAVRLYDGEGMARLLDDDPDLGVLLLEKLSPGRTLHTVEDDEETVRIAAAVMRRLNKPLPVGLEASVFPTVERWSAGLAGLRRTYNGGTGPLPERLVERAERLFPRLIASVREPVLLHGDLHHGNILSAEREPWLAIDPKGLIGEAEYGTLQFLLNRLPREGVAELTRRRIDLFVEELGLSRERLLAWALCHTVLASWWDVNSHGEVPDRQMKLAEMFSRWLDAPYSTGGS